MEIALVLHTDAFRPLPHGPMCLAAMQAQASNACMVRTGIWSRSPLVGTLTIGCCQLTGPEGTFCTQ